MPEFLYSSKFNSNTNLQSEAVIVLPEIFGINQNIRDIVDICGKEFGPLSFGLDFYFPIDQQAHDLDYANNLQTAVDLKSKTKAQDFIKIFNEALDIIQTNNPLITEFVVIGFCFGGKLAFLSGVDSRVKTIFSFYGAGSNTPFFGDKSAVETLASIRKDDKDLVVRGFFGAEDGSIPESDRALTQKVLVGSGINYQSFEYTAGHAFFRIGGVNYNQLASEESWEIVKSLIK